MAEYRTIRVSFWNDQFIEELAPKDKLLYIYLFTCPHVNNLGVIEVSQKKISFETALTSGEVRDGLSRMKDANKILADGSTLWLVNFIRHQTTTSPKLILSLKRLIPSVPSEAIRREICLRYPHVFDDCDKTGYGIHTVSIPSDTVDIPSRELERELELEVEEEVSSSHPETVRLAEHLSAKILAVNPKAKVGDVKSWAKHVDLMIRIDQRTPEEIERVIDWCQQDSFWCSNILSTKKLREKFDQLTAKMTSQNGKKPFPNYTGRIPSYL